MQFKVFSLGFLMSNFLVQYTILCEEASSDRHNATIKPDATTLMVNSPTNPDTFYREILQRAIELMWSQEAHLIQMKIRESSIRRKSKQSAIPMQDIITDTDALYKREIDILADRFWTPKPNERQTIPILPEIFEHFMKNWKKFEDLVDADLKMRPNVEADCKEIKEEMRGAQTKLRAGYEELKEQMKIFEEVKNSAKKTNKQRGRNR